MTNEEIKAQVLRILKPGPMPCDCCEPDSDGCYCQNYGDCAEAASWVQANYAYQQTKKLLKDI